MNPKKKKTAATEGLAKRQNPTQKFTAICWNA